MVHESFKPYTVRGMLIRIYPENPNPREIERVVEILRNDGVIVYPTDGVYAFGCSLLNPRAVERIKALRGKRDTDLTIVCESLSRVADYAKVDNARFKILRRNLPGAFTFILGASSRVPDKSLGKRKEIGIRIPANSIPLSIVERLDAPLVTSSVKDDDEIIEYTTDAELIHERWGAVVDAVIDAGVGRNVPTTLVDLRDVDNVEILREGGGELC